MKDDGLLPWDLMAPARRLFLAHLRGEEGVRDLFQGRGTDDAAVAAAVEERRKVRLPHREALSRAVAGYLRGLDVPAACLRAAERLADPRAVVVVGGQQPGVAGGPLLAFAKAAGVLDLALRLESQGAGPVVPVWWVASEDHDLAEAGAVRLSAGRRGSDLLPRVDGGRRMLSLVRAPEVEDLLGPEAGGEFAGQVRHFFDRPPDASLGTATAALFARAFGPRGLVVVEPHFLRGFAYFAFEVDVLDPGVVAASVREGNDRVREAGYEPVLPDPEGALHFAVDAEGRRTRGGGTPEDLDFLQTRLSGDVVLRVLAQDLALPVAAQVAGPTETEYLAALGPAREALGVFRPAAVPRPGITVLERRVEEALAEFGTDLAGLYGGGGEALRAPAPEGEDPLAEAARRLRGSLREAVGDPGARAASVRSRAQRADRALEELEESAARAAAERRGVGESRRRKVLEGLLPDGVPQERRWSLLPFLLRHGPGLFDRLAEACDGPEPGHRVLRPGEGPGEED